jgi:hypothetical protein
MKAFSKHDLTRFGEYLESVRKGEKKINTSVLFPHDVIRTMKSGHKSGADTLWDNLPDYIPEGASFLPLVDVSGSMMTPVSGSIQALDISVGLGLYLSERNKSAFKDVFMTFSSNPKLEKVSGTLSQRMAQMEKSSWAMNTDLQAAFREILNHANKHHVRVEDMPQTLIIISDMEFDSCVFSGDRYSYNSRQPMNPTLFENMKAQYEEAGYTIPKVVFWNVNARNAKNFPITMKDSNTALISGYSPTIMKHVLGDKLDPYQIVLDTVMVDRYNY